MMGEMRGKREANLYDLYYNCYLLYYRLSSAYILPCRARE